MLRTQRKMLEVERKHMLAVEIEARKGIRQGKLEETKFRLE